MGLSAGADIREELDAESRCGGCSSSPTSTTGRPFPKPTSPPARRHVGGGAEVAIACDMRVGGSNLRMRFPGAALGVPVGPARLVTLCGLAAAKYLLLSSRTVGADEALRIGLVNRVAPAAGTEESALELAADGRRPSPEAVARLKRMLHEWDDVEGRSAVRARARSSTCAPRASCLSVERQRTGPGCPRLTDHRRDLGSFGQESPLFVRQGGIRSRA